MRIRHPKDFYSGLLFVAFGIGRYMVLVQGGKGGENPARILLGGDGWFLANTLAWAAAVGYAIFGAG